MLNFRARFVPGFSSQFDVFPAFMRLAEKGGFEPPAKVPCFASRYGSEAILAIYY
jgi:hypothetical protein